ncbi:hypothetical protein [Peribacillus simplex]|uniref:hypothetical protein n=1 Tax=Peribacillus simplex TaxID=1478 RepID=UPI00366D064A
MPLIPRSIVRNSLHNRFLEYAKELSENESEIFHRYEQWLVEVEKTGMAKTYKMVVLLAMLERGDVSWFKSITSEEAAPFFHSYLTETKYRKQITFLTNLLKSYGISMKMGLES